jgi:hypothetical protein
MGRIWLLPAFFMVWVCGAHAADACGCAPRSARCGPPAEFWRTPVVFSGRVTAIERVKDARQRSTRARMVRMQVLQQFRGAPAVSNGEVSIFTAAACGYPFKTGREYLVYAGLQEGGRLTVTVCSRTMPLERAAADVAYARNAAAGNVPGGQILGEVRQSAEYGSRARRLPGVSVIVTGHGVHATVTTDATGRYSIDVPGAGVFSVRAELPETHYSPHGERRVDVADSRACVEANIDARFNGHITGQVVDAAGRGVAGLTVSHVRPQNGQAKEERTRTLTRDDGAFQIERLQPGPFRLVLELPEGESAAPLSEEAGSGEVGSRGTLKGGQHLILDRILLPAGVPIARLEGSVHTADGWTAPGAKVFLKGEGEDGHILGEPAVADSLGRFVLAVLDGERYEVFAERRESHMPSSRAEFSTPVIVEATAEMPPLRLTLRRRF